MRFIISIFLGIFLIEFSFGQNLIKNSTFDEYYNYYDTNNILVYSPVDWYYVDSLFNHPIYFSTDRYLNKSFVWNIHPDSSLINNGEIANYISILILPNVQRVYTTLIKPLKRGEKYHLSIDIKAFDQSNYFSDLLIGFKDSIDIKMDSCLYQLRLIIPDSVCNEILYHKWITLNKDFVATGMEKVLVISSGTVSDYMKIINSDKNKFFILKYQGPPALKYYIDNVTLTRIENYDDKNKTETYDTLNIGDKIILHNIYFDFDKYELRSTSFDEMDRVYRFMNKNENIRILISGYTDNFGSDVYNNTLSYNRARAVMSYLENKGISCDRISVKGYGEKYPIDSNNTTAGRQNNRRIEMQIIQK